jgi:hypothetical protein
MLVERGLLEPAQLERALARQAQTRQPIGAVLVALEYVDERTLRTVMLDQRGFGLARQQGFGSGLLGELERRGVEPQGRDSQAANASESVESSAGVARHGQTATDASLPTRLGTLARRSRTLGAELATIRRRLHDLAR